MELSLENKDFNEGEFVKPLVEKEYFVDGMLKLECLVGIEEVKFKLDDDMIKEEASLCDGLIVGWIDSLKFEIFFEERDPAKEKRMKEFSMCEFDCVQSHSVRQLSEGDVRSGVFNKLLY